MFTNFDFKTSSIFSVPSPYVSILDELHSGQACPECNSSKIETYGLGTEKIEEVLKSKFVNIPIIRFDHDSTKRKGSLEKIYSQIHESRAAILVGTQMLTKGHDFPRVTMCVILNADNGLISPELRTN